MTDQGRQLTEPLMAQYNRPKELSAASVFKLRPEELQLFFQRDHLRRPDNNIGERTECLRILEKVQYHQGLLDKVASDQQTGIIGDVKDLQRRRKFFGENVKALPNVRSFWAILWDQLDEFYVQLLLIVATILLVLSLFSEEEYKWVEAFSVYFAVLFACLIQTLCDWGKEKQFLRLQGEVQNQKVTVLRGQYGTTQEILQTDLVVGDVVMLQAGDRVPADCLLIEEMDMFVDQSYYNISASEHNLEKQCSYQDPSSDEVNPDPMLLSDSIVMAGSGKAVVLAVGKRVLKEVELGEGEERDAKLRIEHKETPFQSKLTILSKIVGTWANLIAWTSLAVFGLVWFLTVLFTQDMALVEGASISIVVEYLLIAVALLVVCIPEGMPLVISMAMAFSVDSLKSQHLLIKNLDALETAGQLVDILTGKTATLTEGDMTVKYLHIADGEVTVDQPQVNAELLNILHKCLILNNDAKMQMQENRYEPVGSPVDVALLQMLIDHEQPVQDLLVQRERDNCRLVSQIPFSSTRKRRTVAYELDPTMAEGYSSPIIRVVVKGAPELIVPLCANQLDGNCDPIPFSEGDKESLLHDTIQNKIAKSQMKPLVIAYRDYENIEEFEEMKRTYNNFESEESRAVLEQGLTFVAAVGLDDPLRENVDLSIKKIMDANTNVRLVSGDHMWSAISTAMEVGLIPQSDDAEEANAINGDELKSQLMLLMKTADDTEENRGETWVFRDQSSISEFKRNILQTVVVVYRADPQVKHMFTSAIRQTNTVVGVTGEGLNDARALSEANVGFAMGEDGCAAAKDHADIILTDDNFTSVVNAIRWGRNMQDNTRKFIQFQMTVNLSCLTIVILSIITLGFSPFSVFQLLWINLIMDVLAAIAYATEHPHPTELRKERIRKNDPIFTPLMWRAIFSQALYQFLVMIVLLYFGPSMFGIKYEFYPLKQLRDEAGAPTFRLQHQTLLFQTFIFMNLFNMLNCRVLGKMPPRQKNNASVDSIVLNEGEDTEASRRELNIFTRIFDNWWFLIILLVEINLQLIMVQWEGTGLIFITSPLTGGQNLTAILLGAGSLLVALGVKFVPERFLKKLPVFAEDERSLRKTQEAINKQSAFVELE